MTLINKRKVSQLICKDNIFVIIIIMMCILFSGCDPSMKEKADVISKNGYLIHPVSPESSEDLKLNMVRDLSFIPLEATDNSLLSDIAKLERDSTNGFWYILDRKSSNALHVFDSEGSFIRKIKHVGQGPGEYLKINDFFLSDGNWVEVYDGEKQKLLRYDLNNDDLILEKKVPFSAYNYTYLNNGNYLFYKNSQAKNLEDEKYFYKLLVLDSDFKLINTSLPFKINTGINISIMNPNSLTQTQNGVIYNEFNADTLYTVYSDSIRIDHILNYGSYAVPEPDNIEFTSGRDKLNYYIDQTNERIIGVHQIKESERFFSFNFIYKDQAFMYIYNKADTSYMVVNANMRLSNKVLFFPPPVNLIDEDFVSVYTLPMLKEKVSISDLNEEDSYEKALIRGIENQNPILVTYKFNLN